MHASPDEATVERPEVRLRKDRARELAKAQGVTSPTAMAPLFGTSTTNFVRVWNGRILPGEQFIAAALAANPTLTFDDLFEVVS